MTYMDMGDERKIGVVPTFNFHVCGLDEVLNDTVYKAYSLKWGSTPMDTKTNEHEDKWSF